MGNFTLFIQEYGNGVLAERTLANHVEVSSHMKDKDRK